MRRTIRSRTPVMGGCALFVLAALLATASETTRADRIRTVAPIAFDHPAMPMAQTCENPVVGAYGWEDGGTVLGSNFVNNITADNVSDFVYTGDGALRITESPHAGGNPQIYLAHVRNLQDGDVVSASFWTYDDTPGQDSAGYPSVRIWAIYTSGDSFSAVSPHFPLEEQNTAFSSGVGWEEMGHSWTFDSNGGWRDGLLIQARIHSATCHAEHPGWNPQTGQCSTEYFIDDLSVSVCAANPQNVVILFPEPDEEPPGPKTCKDPLVVGAYGWEDGEGTILGGQSITNVTVENTTEIVRTGNHALKATETGHTAGSRILYLAHVDNLSDGDVVSASFWTYDDTPGFGTEQDPVGSVRIWARYTTGSGFSNLVAIDQSMQNTAFSSGIGWEQMGHTWVFDASQGSGLVIEARLFGSPTSCPTCSTEYFFDDISVSVCTANPQNVVILFPEPDEEPPGPKTCKDPLVGAYGWEDGTGTAVSTNNTSGTITLTNITAAEGHVNNGARALKINESPNAPGTPQIHVAFIEHLQHGDIINASVFAYDDTPGANPAVRLFARYAFSGNPEFPAQSAGGNDMPTSGIGWEQLSHTWVFDAGTDPTPRDALLVHVRVYAPLCNPANPSWDPKTETCPTASTDYFVDDLFVEVCSENPNVTITFPDGTVIGDPPGEGACCLGAGCEQLTASACGNAGGVFLGEGANCEACPPPGACCFIAHCEQLLEQSCDAAGGMFLGESSECEACFEPVNILAYWDFNDETLDVSLGSGAMTHSFLPQNVVFFLGTNVNALDPDASPNRAVALQNGFDGVNNGASVEFALDTTGYRDLVMSFAMQRTATGFNANQVAYSADGGDTWFDFDEPFTPASSFDLTGVLTFDFTGVTALDDNPDIIVRITFEGGSTTSQTGNNRMDNVLFTADVAAPACPGDLTGSTGETPDGNVDGFDLLFLLGCWGEVDEQSACAAADLSGSAATEGQPDGVVDGFDLLQLLGNWGPCP